MGQRPTILATARGNLHLPAFLPDATRGAVRTLGADDVKACGVQGVVVNALHLSSNPGTSVLAALGGIHSFMCWPGPVLSDSGGFQLFSMLSEARKSSSITAKGFHYRPGGTGDRKLLTPRKSVRWQVRLGADIVVCLDHCTHPDAPPAEQRLSVDHTLSWARACREELDRLTDGGPGRPLLFAVIQGGDDPALRKECAERILEVGFDGYGFGGWPVRDGALVDAVGLVSELLPPDQPAWALGIGKPEHVVAAAGMGYGLFDCVIPTRDARHGRLYIFRGAPESLALDGTQFYECIYPRDRKHVRSGEPIEATCDCRCCRTYSRAYLHHLFRIGDPLGRRLATMHNLRFYGRLMSLLRRIQHDD
jgi:queuine tRNA-ribosyltransferase